MSGDIIRSDPSSNLGGSHKKIRHESELRLDGAFAYSLNLLSFAKTPSGLYFQSLPQAARRS
jgi:hypothetical protein